jgi:hypothetical protein
MAGTPVKGASPVTFIREGGSSVGKQMQVPLSSLTFDASGKIDASSWESANSISHGDADDTVLTNLLASLVSLGFLTSK